MGGPRVEQIGVDLIAEHQPASLQRKIGQALQLLPTKHPAAGVVGVAQQHDLGPAIGHRGQILQVHAIALGGGPETVLHDGSTHPGDGGVERRIDRRLQHHPVTGLAAQLDHGLQGLEHVHRGGDEVGVDAPVVTAQRPVGEAGGHRVGVVEPGVAQLPAGQHIGNGPCHRGGGGKVHVGHPGRQNVWAELGPLGPASSSQRGHIDLVEPSGRGERGTRRRLD